MYAGHRTRFLNLRDHSQGDTRINPTYREVTGWHEHGRIERLPLLPRALKGRARATAEASAFAALPRPDAIWTAAGAVLAPHLWSQLGPWKRPLLLDLDWTLEQQEELAPIYFNRTPKHGPRRALATLQERALWSRVTLFTPWSHWAAASLRRSGIEDDRIAVVPPGVDLAAWPAHRRAARAADEPLRLLFVGADFARKGGDMLVDVVRAEFAGECELDLVTPADVPPSAGVRVHRATPNSPLLRELYAAADIFVLPTRAECFGIATVEAMASGLPVIVSDTGGVRDIVDDGDTGWLIEPTPAALAAALRRALADRRSLPNMGARGRSVAERRFDGAANDRRIVDLILDQISRHRGAVTPS